jgi:dimethylhistidine N-methyltransferase
LPEYYITRTELKILQTQGEEMATHLGPEVELIGLGTGAGTKTKILLEQLKDPAVYISVDISSAQLAQSSTLFHTLFPALEILPVCADYLQPIRLPSPKRKAARKIVYFPGSTIGNFEPAAALDFLRRIAAVCGPGGGLLIGVDLQKDVAILEAAYNDGRGVTAKFNLNLLARINRELHGNFVLQNWKHRAVYNAVAGRIEMNLISQRDQAVGIGDRAFNFEAGEKIVTEFSYKHTPAGFAELGRTAGFEFDQLWSDEASLFGVFFFRRP